MKIKCILHKASAHEEFKRHIMHLFFMLSYCLFSCLHFLYGHTVSYNKSAGLKHLGLACLLGSLAEMYHQLIDQRSFHFA